MLNQGYFALHVYDFLKKVHIYISIQDYMAKWDLRVVVSKVLGKVWPGFKNKYDLDIYDLR